MPQKTTPPSTSAVSEIIIAENMVSRNKKNLERAIQREIMHAVVGLALRTETRLG